MIPFGILIFFANSFLIHMHLPIRVYWDSGYFLLIMCSHPPMILVASAANPYLFSDIVLPPTIPILLLFFSFSISLHGFFLSIIMSASYRIM